MRFIPLLALSMLVVSITTAQKIKDPLDKLKPLPPRAFDRMIVQDITYAIVGEATPASGLKIDITKPEGTISGMFHSKREKAFWSLITIDLKGGVSGANFSLFRGFSNVNTAFEIRPSIHGIPAFSRAKFGHKPESTRKNVLLNARNNLVATSAKKVIDSFLVVSYIRKYHLFNIETLRSNGKDSLDTWAPNDCYFRDIAIYFIKKLLKNDTIQIVDTTMLTIVDTLGQAQVNSIGVVSNYIDDVSTLSQKYEKLNKTIGTDTLDKMIVNANAIWTEKKYLWWTISPFVKTEKVNEYFDRFEGKDSSYFKSDYRLYYGISGYVNLYRVWPSKIASLLRVGVAMSHSNNLSTLSSYNYETRSSFYSYGSIVTEKTKTGTAYNHNDIKTGFLKQVTMEYYLLPLKSLIPGLFISTNVNHSQLYNLQSVKDREDDNFQVGLEGGLVFNINSREKDKEKSILSVLLYLRNEDLTDSRRTSIWTGVEETRDDFRKRNFSFGIKIGIPINLPQRAK